MPLLVPNKGRTKVISNTGIVGSATPWTGLPSNGTTLLDGTVTEIISAASNIQDSWGISITITDTGASATASEACADILIGGATDDVLIPALICGYSYGASPRSFFFPLHIPQGKRIAATLASVRTSITARILIQLYGGSPPPWKCGRKVIAIGTQGNNATGQTITVAASGGAASVTQLDASLDEDCIAFLPGFQPRNDTTITPAGWMNIGVGVGASTEDRIGTWWFPKTVEEYVSGPLPAMPVFQDVPAGQRISMLASNSGANDTGGYDGLVYGVTT